MRLIQTEAEIALITEEIKCNIRKNELHGCNPDENDFPSAARCKELNDAKYQETDPLFKRAQKVQRNWAFLFIGYKPKYRWWELVVTARKVLLILVSIAMKNVPGAQILVGLVVITLALMLHMQAHPYFQQC